MINAVMNFLIDESCFEKYKLENNFIDIFLRKPYGTNFRIQKAQLLK